jgi:hypothetical protein
MPATSAAVFGHARAIPTMLIGATTTAALVRQFVRTHARHGFVIIGVPTTNTDPLQEILRSTPQFVAIRHKVVRAFADRNISVEIEDNFTRQEKNALYPPDEFHTDRYATIANDPDYAHFGDYSIQGDQYSEGGGRAHNVALHHIYLSGANGSDLRIRHYVSGRHRDISAMWYDALSQLVADLPRLGRISGINNTSVVSEYRTLNRTRAFPGLGKMKEFAMRHHLLLVAQLL